MNDLTHSVYTLRDRREAAGQRRDLCRSQLLVETTALQRAAEGNEMRLNELARSQVQRQEHKERTWALLRRLEGAMQTRNSDYVVSKAHSQAAAKYQTGFDRIRR